MKKNTNSKGFTLIELLIVVVILALIATAAAMAIIPMFNQARADTFITDSIALIDGAKTSYTLGSRPGGSCFDIKYLTGESTDGTGAVTKTVDKTLNDKASGVVVASNNGETYTITYYDGELLVSKVVEGELEDYTYDIILSEANKSVINKIPDTGINCSNYNDLDKTSK